MQSLFSRRYDALNTAQRKAVDTIDGPVMVVAGPGTGKTELLSVRVANILQKTDTLPGNILCLTFTESAATNMRERLVGLLGPDAYKVAVHTFHSFGSEVINSHGEYFYSGAHFRPADELSTYQILSEILAKLPHDNPLASKMNDRFTYLRDIQTSISELKRGGLTPDELDLVIARNNEFIQWVRPNLQAVFSDRLSTKTIAAAANLAEKIMAYDEPALELPTYHSLAALIGHSLLRAVAASEEARTTKPLTAWKSAYTEKDAHDTITLKDERRGEKLKALSGVYYDYLLAMQKDERYDYDDMILRVVQALEVFDELRFSLQEQYQYILVDEFQDTNDAQMRLVWNLTNNPVAEGRPNLMVVGDDDQAIYRFQGADMSNVLDFTTRYRDVAVIALTDNYRSRQEILDTARSVIVQAGERLENSVATLSKHLTPHRGAGGSVTGATYETPAEARAALAQQIARDRQQDDSSTRAIIGRHHRELVDLLPHLAAAGVPVRYERQDNVLESEPVRLLEQTAHVVWHLSRQEFDAANDHLAEVLAHPAWNIAPRAIWELSLEAHRQKKYWLEVMLENDALKDIAEWFIVGSGYAHTEPLEYMLDYLFGVTETSAFSSPYKTYFFGKTETLSAAYIAHLEALQKIRAAIRDYRPGTVLSLDDFVAYLDMYRELNLSLTTTGSSEQPDAAVTLLSAHKAKGLEFDTVYLTDANETVWGNGARSRSRLISFPSNLPLSPSGDGDDERLRLLYVALTRARHQLVLTAARTNDNGKALLPVGAFENVVSFTEAATFATQPLASALQTAWYTPLTTLPVTDKRALLAPLLETYKLSATHLNNFLDLTKGGPEHFLLHSFLHIPEAISPSAAYGSAVHATLQRAHQHLVATKKKRPVEDVLRDFEAALQQSQLSELDRKKYLDRGSKALTTYLEQRYDTFTVSQQVERSFSGDHVVVRDAVITGALDLIDIDADEKTIFVTDYKTGKAAHSWQGKDPYEKIKLHHYEQQLMMYKLLIEHSRQFAGYTVTGARLEFVEPDKGGRIVSLDYTYSDERLQEFERLVAGVWRKIQALDFTSPEGFSSDLKGILDFEQEILLT